MTSDSMTVTQVVERLRTLTDAMPARAAKGIKTATRRAPSGDLRDGSVYLMDKHLLLAVQVAVATGRPLLLTGDPGSGKSSLARYLAEQLKWRYYEHVVTGRTEASDLLWQFDTVRKLGDASGSAALDDSRYVEPGVLWWALNRDGARRRGADTHNGSGSGNKRRLRSVAPAEPFADINAGRSSRHAVVLIDEIDKADPDVPNALLVPLGSSKFVVRETQSLVEASAAPATSSGRAKDTPAAPLLVIITSNGERELPPAFVRRCVTHHLDAPDEARLQAMALAHATREGRVPDADEMQRIKDLAHQAVQIREELRALNRKGAGAAEFLDAVRASRELGFTAANKDDWERLLSLTLRKGAART